MAAVTLYCVHLLAGNHGVGFLGLDAVLLAVIALFGGKMGWAGHTSRWGARAGNRSAATGIVLGIVTLELIDMLLALWSGHIIMGRHIPVAVVALGAWLAAIRLRRRWWFRWVLTATALTILVCLVLNAAFDALVLEMLGP